MYAAQGIGLAAPQISISQRLTVIDVSFKKNPEEKLVLINPGSSRLAASRTKKKAA